MVRDTGAVLSIRPARSDDADAVARIYVESWNQGFGHLVGRREHSPDRRERWRLDLADPAVDWFVAVDVVVVGFAGVSASRDPVDPLVGELQTIAVDPRHWRRGIGRLLMTDALDRLRGRFERAVLWTVAGYEAGHSFYLATGWTPLGTARADGTEVAFGRDLD